MFPTAPLGAATEVLLVVLLRQPFESIVQCQAKALNKTMTIELQDEKESLQKSAGNFTENCLVVKLILLKVVPSRLQD